MNLAQKLRGMIQNDVLDIAVDPAVLGGDPAPGSAKRLRVVYRYGGRQFEISEGDFERIRIPGTGGHADFDSQSASRWRFFVGRSLGRGIAAHRVGAIRRGHAVHRCARAAAESGADDALSLTVDNAAMGRRPGSQRVTRCYEVTYEYRGVSSAGLR
jgi:hypothetical protein